MEFVQIENGMILPQTQGKLYCSRRDPVKEASNWFCHHQESINQAEHIIILGLGAGFHLLNFESTQQVTVVELNPQLIEVFEGRQHPSKPQIQYLEGGGNREGTVLEFRPAWVGNEERYEAVSRRLRGCDQQALIAGAERRHLREMAEHFKRLPESDQRDLTIKDLVHTIDAYDQSFHSKMWRCLRELVQ